MKRLLLVVAVMVLSLGTMMAQDANRRGFFLELGGGVAVGEVLRYETTNGPYHDAALKGGAVATLDFGYRFVTSRSLAVNLQIGTNANLAEFADTWLLRLMSGIRWTSRDFGNGMSIYTSLGTGVGVGTWDFDDLIIPVDFSVGLNITRNLSAGIFVNGNILAVDGYNDTIQISGIDNDNHWSYYLAKYYRSNVSLGLRLGYRF